MKIIFSLLFFSNIVFAQSSQTTIDICDITAIKQNTYEIRNCRSSYSDPVQGLTCIQNSHKKLSSNVCSPQLKISYNNIAELYKSLIYLADPKNNKKYTNTQMSDKWDSISNLIEKESNDAVEFTKNEYSRREIEYYQNRATKNIEISMNILGATVQNNNQNSNSNTSPFRTYILNGKMITCSTLSTLTTCN